MKSSESSDNSFRERIVNVTRRRVGEIAHNERNPKQYTDEKQRRLNATLAQFGKAGVLLTYIDDDGTERFFDGNSRRNLDPNEEWYIAQTDLSQKEVDGLVLFYDALAEPDWSAELAKVLIDEAEVDDGALDGMLQELAAELEVKDAPKASDAEPQVSRADELQKEWGVELGQMWRLPSRTPGQEHRLICGDCTDEAVVKRVMGGEKASLCHADPPYGMGKEKDGIANDNLYREKLDAFQMRWWNACRPSLEDNAGSYIWGNAEDLWRLWYVGIMRNEKWEGLRDSERLTLRNEIVWNKGHGQGMGAEDFRSYAPATERCLFFMLGEQGFNNNADNYWEGWEPIRVYLKAERDKMGWNIATCKTLAGHSPSSGCHWFDASQWSFVTEDVYNAWRAAANGQAFKREYDDLKREFYATRAYFDNTHDNMTDVWQYQRVQGDDRHGHATPKPVQMIERVIKSSCPDGGNVYAPFSGTSPEIIAAENLARQCRAVEISPAYVAVALQRYKDAFGIEPELIP